MAPQSPPSPTSPPKPLPQPIEETRGTNREPATKEPFLDTRGKKPRRQLPEPVESSTSLSKRMTRDDTSHDDSHTKNSITSTSPLPPQPMEKSPPAQKPRTFAPQMIETTRRRRKSTDTTPCVTPSDKTEASPGDQDHLPQHMRRSRPSAAPIPPTNSPIVSTDHLPQVPVSKFSSSKLAEKREKRHSFRVPDLPAIPSQSGTESNVSSVPSLSTSPSAESDETELGAKKKKKRKNIARRESQDARWSGYLLRLAAKTAEKQLRDQAMAAYPNEHAHEPVDHYAIDRDSDEAEVEAGVGKLSVDGLEGHVVADRKPARHRESDAGWDMAEMRKHQHDLEQQKQDQWAADGGVVKVSEIGRRKSTRAAIQEAHKHTVQREVGGAGAPSKNIIGWQKDNEMKPMQKAASPPMAGENLKFPKCLSPQATHLDVNQYPHAKRNNDMKTHQHTGLWTPGGSTSCESSVSGLWNGVCNAANQEALHPQKVLQTGLLTPAIERGDPLAGTFKDRGRTRQLPPSPDSSQEETSNLDTILRREQSIEAEFNDQFVTQVYNYLSLGYPNLARKFDSELSKITNIPLEDLRMDDERCNAKGYVGAPEGTGVDASELAEGEGRCERWCALRLYVREWGRQQPGMGWAEELEGGWGASARKGSWAI